MSTARGKTSSKATTGLDDAAERARQLNERIIETSQKSGTAYLSAYERTLEAIARAQETLASAVGSDAQGNQGEWLTTLLDVQLEFARDISKSVTSYYREILE
jgi:hypothetical protein